MSNDIHLAFAHPSERSAATAGTAPLDRISLRDHIVDVEIGAFQAERGTRQRISFNIVVEVQPLTGEIDDDVDRILSYDRVTEAIAAELAAERLNLLETLAERVADRILSEPQAMRVFVRIEKLDRGPGALGVEIVRAHDDPSRNQLLEENAPRARVAFLSNDAIATGNLARWIDMLGENDTPLILCVGFPDTPCPKAGNALAQRRIDLLAIEQNAWRLAAQDARCKVVATRTELDWAMKNGQICVWAPSKLVLDAVDGPEAAMSAPASLAAWFAAEIGAFDMVVIGAEAPVETNVSIRTLAIGETAL